ncbi:MAG: BatD family protein [Bacteroidales bacterium]|nr:BatD family protein [Bacteroidales bacterium]
MKKLLSAIILAAVSAAAFAQSALRVEAPNVVAANEQFNVTFIYEGDENISDFQWNAGDDFQLVWGPQTGRSTSIQIINGKRTKSSQVTYTYILLPKRTGTFAILPATAKVKGKEISSSAASVEVVGDNSSSGEQSGSEKAAVGNSGAAATGSISDDDIFMRFTLSRDNVVVGEPVVATLKLYHRVNIAGFEDARFPTFNGFWSQEVEAPTNIEFQRESLNDRIYNAAVLRKWVIIPQQAGTINIDPAELVCLVNIRVSSGGASIFDGFFDDYRTVRKRIYSQPARISVSALPSGAPASFGGGVGTFTMSASLSKDSLATHEAASLVVTIKGRGNVSLLGAPKVSFPPDMEVYDTKVSESIDKGTGGTVGSKTYEFPFIPRSHGDFTIPSISYSYYDINTGSYTTLTAPEINYSVAKGKDIPASSGAVSASSVSRSGVRNLNEDIRFIAVKKPGLVAKGDFFVFSSLFWALVAAVAVLAVLTWVSLRKMAARRADIAGTRTRKASKAAVRRLKLAGDFLKKNLYTAFYEELHKALLGYVSDKLNIAVADLSKDRISEQLASENVPAEVIEEFVGIVDACEFARYSPDAGYEAMERHYDAAVNVISSIESNMKGKKNIAGAAAKGAAMALVMMLMMPAGSIAADLAVPAAASVAGDVTQSGDTGMEADETAAPASGNYMDMLWEKACTAYTDGQWEEAVSSFSAISDAGLESAALYCNIGNAYFKSGNYPYAILYFERALKLDPSYSDARYNLEIASHQIQDRIDPVPEFILAQWGRDLCYLLDSDMWAVLAIVFFALCAAMVLLFLLGATPAAKGSGFFTGIVFLLFSLSSLGFSLWQRSEYMNADSAIVTRPVASVKSSPSSEASTDLFILHEGTKVTILDEVGAWRNISLADGRQGWMPTSDMEVI